MFKKYHRKQTTELREVTEADIQTFSQLHQIPTDENSGFNVSISDADLKNGSPKLGDMIARNPEDHKDQWLIAARYFKDNFDPM